MRQPRTTQPPPGMRAGNLYTCPVCKDDIEAEDRVYFRRGERAHVGCSGGADDE